MIDYVRKVGFSLVLALVISLAFAQKPEVFSQNDKAIKGYDPFAYFTDSKPVMGKEEFKVAIAGANWYFSSEKNLKIF